MHVIEQGEATKLPIIFLHGMGTGARAWEPQLDSFTPTHRVLAPDLPGFGRSPGPFHIQAAVDELAALCDERAFPTITLCGLSLGAIVALAFALAHPDRVDHLILCAGFARLPDDLRARQEGMAQAVRAMGAEQIQTALLPELVAAVPAPFRQAALDDISRLTPQDIATIMEEAGTFDVAGSLAGLDIPALVLCGANDEPNGVLSRDLARFLPGSRFELVPDAGHVANLDAPAQFTAALRAFLG